MLVSVLSPSDLVYNCLYHFESKSFSIKSTFHAKFDQTSIIVFSKIESLP